MFGRKYKKENIELKRKLDSMQLTVNELVRVNDELTDNISEMMKKYPFEIGETVYDLQLRSSKGRFTKTKASREHSLINEVVVDKKNYFGLVERYNNKDVFTDKNCAEEYLKSVCVE